MASRKLKIYQGVASRIYVTIKNSDRKVIPAAGKLFTAYIVSEETEELVLQRQLDEIDAAAGEWEMTLLEGETGEWRPGRYRMVVTIQDENGDEYNLYSDLAYNAVAELHLTDNAMAPFKAATTVGGWQERIEVFYSSAYPGDAQEGRHDGLHTIALYLTDFTGRFWIQASLENTPPSSDGDWFNVDINNGTLYIDYSAETGIQNIDFNINAQWVRFAYDPDPLNNGTVDTILYRV